MYVNIKYITDKKRWEGLHWQINKLTHKVMLMKIKGMFMKTGVMSARKKL